MARQFTAASSERISYIAGAVKGAAPITYACWFYPDSDTGNGQTLMTEEDASATSHYYRLVWQDNVANNPLRFHSFSGGNTDILDLDSVISAGSWWHCCFTLGGGGASKIYAGGTANTNTGTGHVAAVANVDSYFIGARYNAGTPIQFANGRIAEAAIWNVVLTDAEVDILAAGYSPAFVRPTELLSYRKLFGRQSPEPDHVGGFHGTLTGTSVGAHPRIIYPSSPQIILPATVAGGVTGTAAAVLAALTGSATGSLGISGTAAAALAALTGSATGTSLVAVTGTASATMQALIASATGTHQQNVTGTAAATLAALTAAATGTSLVAVTGTAAAALEALVASAAGTVTALTPITGTGAATLEVITASATGLVVTPITGTAAATLEAIIAAAIGTGEAFVLNENRLIEIPAELRAIDIPLENRKVTVH